MPQEKDITGERFNHLTAIRRVENIRGRVAWEFRCDCGNLVQLEKGCVLYGNTHSCGCQRRQQCGILNFKHGESDSQLHYVWRSMKKRCYNPNDAGYQNYGGRGIKVCDEWRQDFMSFKTWAMDNGYAKGLSIDRIDNDGNYEPSNCRWTDRKTQSHNKRTNHNLTYNGVTKTIGEWAESLGMNYNTLIGRINVYGWSVEDALSKPVRKYKTYRVRK